MSRYELRFDRLWREQLCLDYEMKLQNGAQQFKENKCWKTREKKVEKLEFGVSGVHEHRSRLQVPVRLSRKRCRVGQTGHGVLAVDRRGL